MAFGSSFEVSRLQNICSNFFSVAVRVLFYHEHIAVDERMMQLLQED
jgi:hypothetical protein